MRRCALRLMQVDASEFLRRTAIICLEVGPARNWSLDSFAKQALMEPGYYALAWHAAGLCVCALLKHWPLPMSMAWQLLGHVHMSSWGVCTS